MAPRKSRQSPPIPANAADATDVASAAKDASDVAPAAASDVPAVTLRLRTGPQLRKKEFLDRVIQRSGLPRNQARIAVDATLAQLAELLLASEEANLPPLGKLKVTRTKDNGRNRVLMVKLVHAPDGPVDPDATDVLSAGEDA
jgi:hypothetical protein